MKKTVALLAIMLCSFRLMAEDFQQTYNVIIPIGELNIDHKENLIRTCEEFYRKIITPGNSGSGDFSNFVLPNEDVNFIKDIRLVSQSESFRCLRLMGAFQINVGIKNGVFMNLVIISKLNGDSAGSGINLMPINHIWIWEGGGWKVRSFPSNQFKMQMSNEL